MQQNNYEQRKSFFETLFDKSRGYIEIRTIEKGKVRQLWFKTSDIDVLLKELEKPHFKKVNVYFGVCPRGITRGTEKDVCQVNCLWVDLDSKNRENKRAVKKRLDDFDPEPSIIVNSGNGYHIYWLFDKMEDINSEEDILRIKGFNKGLAEELKGDKGIDLSRILRVPGTKNMKDPKETLAVTIIKFEPQIRYSLKGQFLARFKRDIDNNKIERIEVKKDNPASDIPDRLFVILSEHTKIMQTWTGQRKDLKDTSRSGYDMALANLLMPFDFTDSELISIFRDFEFGKGKDATRQYLDLTIGKAKGSWKQKKSRIDKMKIEPEPKKTPLAPVKEEESKKEPSEKLKPIGLEQLLSAFKKWLELEETEYIEIILATLLSNQFEGDPVWLFVIGASGASKTEILRSFKNIDSVYTTSKLTAQTLISGKVVKGYDPSLLPRLDKKTLILKDFTTILSMRSEDKMIIFSDLREAYDGYLEKDFGNIGHRTYHAHFTIIAGVTPVLDKYTAMQQNLGERFLKLRLVEKNPEAKILRAIQNIDSQIVMRKELNEATEKFFAQDFNLEAVKISLETQQRMKKLSQYTASLRTSVSRNPYSRNIIEYIPEKEVGTRIGIQLAKLGKALSAIRNKKEVTEEEMKILTRVARDTIPKKVKILTDCLITNKEYGLTTTEIKEKTGIESETCRYALMDLEVLGFVKSRKIEGGGNVFHWEITEELLNLVSAL